MLTVNPTSEPPFPRDTIADIAMVLAEMERASDIHQPFRSLREVEAVIAKQAADLIRDLRISYNPRAPTVPSHSALNEARQLAATVLRFLIESPQVTADQKPESRTP